MFTDRGNAGTNFFNGFRNIQASDVWRTNREPADQTGCRCPQTENGKVATLKLPQFGKQDDHPF